MNFKKTILALMVLGLFGGLISIQVQGTQAQEPYTIFLPAMTKNTPHIPIFGVEVKNTAAVGLAQSAGNYWVRKNGLEWSNVQPTGPGDWKWDNVAVLESQLKVLGEAGMETILIVRSTPTWAQKLDGYYCGPIEDEDLDDFANFMNQVVQRYSKPPYNVTYYEIWNEPGAPPPNPSDTDWANYSPYGCWGDPTQADYGAGDFAAMLAHVYPAVKSANADAQVVLGGLLLDCDPRAVDSEGKAYCEEENVRRNLFFDQVLAHGGGAFFDYINFHGYNYYVPAWNSVILSERNVWGWQANGGAIAGKKDYLDELQAAYGLSKPYIVSESALILQAGDEPSAGYEQAKAEYVVWLYTRNMAEGIAATTWYTLDYPGWRGSGMLKSNLDPYPAFTAYEQLNATLGKALFEQELNLGEGILGFQFRSTHKIWVLFSEDGTAVSIPVPSKFAQAYDLYGEVVEPSDGVLTFSRPIYIEFSN